MCRVKSLNFMDNILALTEARSRGANEAILLNGAGFLAEGSITNLFVIQEGIVATPPLEAGALPGIIRGLILELAPAAEVGVIERNLTPEDLARASEAFLTNALMGVMPLVKLGRVTRDWARLLRTQGSG
jgi:branched-chain amino acid aminotransferase